MAFATGHGWQKWDSARNTAGRCACSPMYMVVKNPNASKTANVQTLPDEYLHCALERFCAVPWDF